MCLSMRHFTETTFGWPLKGPGPEHLEERDLLLSSRAVVRKSVLLWLQEKLHYVQRRQREREDVVLKQKNHV